MTRSEERSTPSVASSSSIFCVTACVNGDTSWMETMRARSFIPSQRASLVKNAAKNDPSSGNDKARDGEHFAAARVKGEGTVDRDRDPSREHALRERRSVCRAERL